MQVPTFDCSRLINPLPHWIILYLSKLEEFLNCKLHVNQIIEFFSERLDHIVEKRENASYKYFLLFPQCFQKSFLGVL